MDEYIRAAEAVNAAESHAYRPMRTASPASPATTGVERRHTLFPTGHFETLPPQAIDARLPRRELALNAPPDLAARRGRFRERNSPASLKTLCARLRNVLIPGTPGLEAFEEQCRLGHASAALEAYRDYFFAKLADPESHGAVTENILFELTRDRGKGELLLRPSEFVLEKNMNDWAVAQIDKEVVLAKVGPPGEAAWVPHGLEVPAAAANDGRVRKHAFWQTPEGKDAWRTLEYFRSINSLPGDRAEFFGGGIFPALLASYAIDGDRQHLARWCEYHDDWAMNARSDQEAFSIGLRCAMDLETQFPRATLNLLRIVLDERPAMAREFDAPSLARLIMALVVDAAPYTIRARCAEMANWGIMGLGHQLHLGRFLHEFKAMDYFNREAWRLWNANMIQHRTLDGENIEAWDDGHNWVTIEFSEDSVPYARLPKGVDALDLTLFWDNSRIDQRSKLTHIGPPGTYWPSWENHPMPSRNTIHRYYRPGPTNRHGFDLIEKEPGAQSRIETLIGAGRPASGRLPEVCSDLSPYGSMAYLRESWSPDADYFVLQNVPVRSQSQEDCSRTMYSLAKNDRVLVEAHGLVVDRKPDNRYQDAVRTGGKTDYCGEAGRHVRPERFHTSPYFDFAEAQQDSPYALHRLSHGDAYGLYRQALPRPDPEPIRDVTVLRQVFGPRGAGLWIVCDRIENRGSQEREYAQFFTLPARIEANGFADRVRLLAAAGAPLVEVDPQRRRIRGVSPGFENASLYCFSPSELTFANVLGATREHQALADSPLRASKPNSTKAKRPTSLSKSR